MLPVETAVEIVAAVSGVVQADDWIIARKPAKTGAEPGLTTGDREALLLLLPGCAAY